MGSQLCTSLLSEGCYLYLYCTYYIFLFSKSISVCIGQEDLLINTLLDFGSGLRSQGRNAMYFFLDKRGI